VSAQSALRDREPADFELIETMRWEPEGGFIRRDRHLARLHASATELGFSHDPQRVEDALAKAVGNSETALRTRLTLARNGTVNATVAPYVPLPANQIWKLRLAREKLGSTDPLLRHKTSRREMLVRARAEYPANEADEVLLANERGEICEGTITNVFADFGDGILATPSLDCGLLPGILRGELLDQGHAREAVFDLVALRSAKALFVGNSLRGLIPALLA
jgi:4-amino-4-deoxychorismate lyase